MIIIRSIFQNYLPSLVSVGIILWYLGNESSWFIFAFVGFFVFFSFWVRIFKNKMKKWRVKGKDEVTVMDRAFVRRVMSKFEILQNQKQQVEIDKLYESHKARCSYKIKEKVWQAICYDGATLFTQVLYLFIVLSVSRFVFDGQA